MASSHVNSMNRCPLWGGSTSYICSSLWKSVDLGCLSFWLFNTSLESKDHPFPTLVSQIASTVPGSITNICQVSDLVEKVYRHK